MELDPASWGGLELGLKMGPVKTSNHYARMRSCTPHFYISGTAESIALKFGM